MDADNQEEGEERRLP